MVNLVHIVAVNTPVFAVFTDRDGTPQFEPVLCLGTMEAEGGARIVSGFAIGDASQRHLKAADWRPNFVGYATTIEPEKWIERCKTKLAAWLQAEEKAKHDKIIVPDTAPKIFN